MISNWETSKAKSTYHFDPTIEDNSQDVAVYLGQLEPNWQSEIAAIVEQSTPATWASRGYKGEGVAPPRDDLLSEEYDLERFGYGKDYTITHLSWAIPEVLQKHVDAFGLGDCMARLHIQKPGEVWNLHLDKLGKWCPEDPTKVMRIFIQLTDWQNGQFWEFGNFHWNQWGAGEVITFDWQNMPHCTANAGMHPRVTLQLTGIRTDKTDAYIASLPK
jgi:hypothetical protein